MISDDNRIHDRYVFRDFLVKNPKLSRDEAEYEWHKEKQAPDRKPYDPNPDKIDFQGLTYDDIID